jgi:hypothetical protein
MVSPKGATGTMALFTNDGLDSINRYVLGLNFGFDMTIRLYVNNYVPTLTSALVNFTECTSGGYSAYFINPTLWSGGTVAGITTYTYPQQTWTFTAYSGPPVLVYGYFVTYDAAGIVVFAEASAVPFNVPLAGGQILLTPSWIDENL